MKTFEHATIIFKIICRLRTKFKLSSKTEKVKVDDVRRFILSSGIRPSDLSKECGRIARKAFPGIVRKSSNSIWYYYGHKSFEVTQPTCSTTSAQDTVKSTTKDTDSALIIDQGGPGSGDNERNLEENLSSSNACLDNAPRDKPEVKKQSQLVS